MEEKMIIDILYQLKRIADSLERLANNGEPVSPNLERPISEFKNFDWSSIDASIVRSDKDGPTHVEYGGLIWIRRSPENKYEPAIWYSRTAGKDDEGKTRYLRLITFKTVKDADPLPEKVEAAALKGYREMTAVKTAQENGVARPYPPDILRKKIQERMEAKKGQTCTLEQRNTAIKMIEFCFHEILLNSEDIKLAQKIVQDYLFGGIVSMDNVKAEFILALLAWLDVKQDSGGALRPSEMAIKEAQLVWHKNRL
jgi:hypothetical protein